MRQLAAILAAVPLAICLTSPASAQTKKDSKDSKGKTNNTKAPAIPIPGVGGAAPVRKKPLTPSPSNPLPTTGPTLPQTQGPFPATVVAPGQNPALPGLPGLQARPVNPLLFGVNLRDYSLDGAAGNKKIGELVKGAGITNVRIQLHWRDIEPTRGLYSWRVDNAVQFAGGQNAGIVAVVDGIPEWASHNAVKELERFAAAASSRYKGRINLWEFGDEPDLSPENRPDPRSGLDRNPAPRTQIKAVSYAPLLLAFSRGIKRANPPAQVAVGGLATQDTRFLSELYGTGAKSAFDAVALHPTVPKNVINFAWIDAIRGLMERNGDSTKPIWITDWGWPTAPGSPDSVSDLHQARLIRQSLAGMRDRPFIVQAAYRTINDVYVRHGEYGDLMWAGLIDRNMAPKPGYSAFKEMATGFNPEAVARFARVPLVGALPLAEEAGVRGSAVQVVVDADKSLGSLKLASFGVSQGYEPGLPNLSAELAPALKATGRSLVRFDPFPNPDWVKQDRIVVVEGNGPAQDRNTPRLDIRWQYADAMMDGIEQSQATAMMNIATMPTALSSPAGNPRMPRDMNAWSAYVRQVVRRYNIGGRRVATYWELSNEPNRGDFLLEEWLQLYATFAKAVIAEDPKAQVGGPSLGGFDERWLMALVERCERDKIPLHFLSWHVYGQPVVEDTRQIDSMRTWLQGHNDFKNTKLIVSEWNRSARVATENDSLAAASQAASNLEGLINARLDGAFFYSLREGPDQRNPGETLTGRWGLLTYNNRPKATYNLFKLLSKMGDNRLSASSEETDIHALASSSPGRVTVLLWSDPVGDASSSSVDMPVYLRVKSLPWRSATSGEQWTIDARHGDISQAANRAGLESAGRFTIGAGDVEIPVVMSPHSVTLLELRPGKQPRIDLSLEAPRYVVYDGSRVDLAARIHNPDALPQRVSVSLSGRDYAGTKPQTAVVTVGPGQTVSVPMSAPIKTRDADGQCYFTVTASTGETASASVKLAPPLSAKLEKSRIDVAPSAAGPDATSGKATTRFRLILDNRSDATMNLGVAGGSTSLAITLPGKRSTTVPITVAVPAGNSGIFSTPVKVIQNGRVMQTLTASVGTLSTTHMAERIPRINADLAEWADAEKLSLTPALRDHRGSFASLNAQAMTLWDDHAFYLAVTISDDGSAPVSENPSPVPELQFSLSPVDSGDNRSAVSNEKSATFTVDLDKMGQRLYRGNGDGIGKIVTSSRVAARKEGRHTVYEIEIPWSELTGVAPSANQRFAFALRVNDTKRSTRPGLEWAGALPGRPAGELPALVLKRP